MNQNDTNERPLSVVNLPTVGKTEHHISVSGLVALGCFLSIVALPWYIYWRGEGAQLMDLGAFLVWFVFGLFAAFWRAFGDKIREGYEKGQGKRHG